MLGLETTAKRRAGARILPIWTLTACLALGACGKPAEDSGDDGAPSATGTQEDSQEETGTDTPQELRWSTPEGWREVPPANAQRTKQYEIDVEGQEPLTVAISHWASGVGGLSANLDRWTRSLGLGEDDQPPKIDTESVGGMTVTLFDGVGSYTSMQGAVTEDARLLTAYIESLSRFDGVYTFRLVGPSDAVEPHVERFRQLALGL